MGLYYFSYTLLNIRYAIWSYIALPTGYGLPVYVPSPILCLTYNTLYALIFLLTGYGLRVAVLYSFSYALLNVRYTVRSSIALLTGYGLRVTGY